MLQFRKNAGAKLACIILAMALWAPLLLTACTPEDKFNVVSNADGSTSAEPEMTDPEFVRTPPPVQMPETGDNQVSSDTPEQFPGYAGFIDLSNISKGYVGASVTAPVKCKFVVAKGEDISTGDKYEMTPDGSTSYYPLAYGDGVYTFVVYTLLDAEASTYSKYITAQATVTLESEFAPFLVPNRIVNYTPDSNCVQKSYDIAEHAATDLEVTMAVYAWIADNIDYDEALAAEVGGKPGTYEPDPDATLASGKGICYDYASLAAAMLRANAIPCKLIKGEVLNGESGVVYHAWNMVYLKEAGWIAIELPSKPNDWQRIDTTFAAAGSGSAMGQFIGDGENYTEFTQH